VHAVCNIKKIYRLKIATELPKMRTLMCIAFLSVNLDLISGFNFDLENLLIIKNSYQPKSQFGASISIVADKSSAWYVIIPVRLII